MRYEPYKKRIGGIGYMYLIFRINILIVKRGNNFSFYYYN
jgi:hypothetical protein